MGTSIKPLSNPLPINSYRTRTNAIGKLMIVVRIVVTIPNSKLFNKARCCTGLCNIKLKNSTENWPSV